MGTEMGKRQGSNKQQNRNRAPTKQVKARQPKTQMEMLRRVTTDHQRRKTTQSGFPWDWAPWSVTNKCYGLRMRRFRRASLVNSLTNWLNNTKGGGVGGGWMTTQTEGCSTLLLEGDGGARLLDSWSYRYNLLLRCLPTEVSQLVTRDWTSGEKSPFRQPGFSVMLIFDMKALNIPSLHSQPNSIKQQRAKSSLDKQGIKLLKFCFPTQYLSFCSCLFKANLRFRRLLSKIFWCSTSSRPTSCLWWWGNHMRRALIRKIKLPPRTNPKPPKPSQSQPRNQVKPINQSGTKIKLQPRTNPASLSPRTKPKPNNQTPTMSQPIDLTNQKHKDKIVRLPKLYPRPPLMKVFKGSTLFEQDMFIRRDIRRSKT